MRIKRNQISVRFYKDLNFPITIRRQTELVGAR